MENVSKIVVLKENAKRFGYILDVAIDDKSLELLGWYVVEEETENEFFVSYKDVKFVEAFAFVDGVEKLQFVANRASSLIGKTVFGVGGTFLGCVEKIKIFRRKLQVLVTNKCEVKASQIKQIGDDFIFLGKRTLSLKAKSFPRADEPESLNVTVLGAPFKVEKPERVSLSTSFYLGKVSTQDIFGYNSERLVVKGEKLTKAVVEKVKKHNRLNELFFALKK